VSAHRTESSITASGKAPAEDAKPIFRGGSSFSGHSSSKTTFDLQAQIGTISGLFLQLREFARVIPKHGDAEERRGFAEDSQRGAEELNFV
jgi:hypothetical protein